MIQLFNTICFQPLLNLLVYIYNYMPWHDIGLAIIALTIIIKLILYPLNSKALKSQKALQTLQPKMDEIKEKFKDDKEAQAKEMMNLYKESKVNPLSSCLPILIQLPFLIAIYQVFIVGLSNGNLTESLYPFVDNPERINTIAFGFMELAKPQIVLAILAGLAQYWQVKMMVVKKPAIKSDASKDESMMASMNKQMMYMMPLMTVVIGATLPGGLSLYWLVLTLLTILQQFIVFRKHDKAAESQVI